jgi:hypothetical protein
VIEGPPADVIEDVELPRVDGFCLALRNLFTPHFEPEDWKGGYLEAAIARWISEKILISEFF